MALLANAPLMMPIANIAGRGGSHSISCKEDSMMMKQEVSLDLEVERGPKPRSGGKCTSFQGRGPRRHRCV